MTRFSFLMVAAALAVGLSQAAIAEPILVNGDFEALTTPLTEPYGGVETLLYTETYQVPGLLANGVPGWTFGPSAGHAWDGIRTSNDTNWATQVFGTQEAFVNGLGTFSQVIDNFDAGTLTVSFYAAAATAPSGLSADPVEVTLDGTPLTFGLSNATTVTPESTSLVLYTTNAIAVTSGSHTLAFEGTVDSGAYGAHSTWPASTT